MNESYRPDDTRPRHQQTDSAVPLRDEQPPVVVDDDPVVVEDSSDATRAERRRQHMVSGRTQGIQVGAAFFGWLTAIGVAALLLALVAGAGTALGLTEGASVESTLEEATASSSTSTTIGWVGGVLLLVVLAIAYFCGGYVAGRMARFHGAQQGVGVWVWGLLITIVVAVLAWIAGSSYDVLARLDLPRIPVDQGTMTVAGVIAVIAAVVVTLVAAMLGGLAGMRFHRIVDAEVVGGS
jgi:hypothetical protein